MSAVAVMDQTYAAQAARFTAQSVIARNSAELPYRLISATVDNLFWQILFAEVSRYLRYSSS